uniref:Uncharacterized protein n=1 Tax=Trichobilharzia regenti TaxID=157069 RepID=A0AA85JEV0_TRIRE|nr:unnamed protein product [Trichobilharzia regenti]
MPVESSKISYTHEKRSVPDINEIKSSHVQEFNDPMTATTTTEKHLMYKVQQSLLKFKSIKQKTRRSFIQNDDYGYCISKQLQCDSIVHCHNARDELPSLRMNPTDLPGQLLRALVGAHLTPADLNNVGCTVYKLSSSTIIQSYNNEKHKGIQISNTDESQGGSNKTNLSRFISNNPTASSTLIIGCIVLCSFIIVVLGCSCYQCCYRRKLRTIQGSNKSINYWSSSSSTKVTGIQYFSEEQIKTSLIHAENNTEESKESQLNKTTEKYMIGRSATDGTLSTLAESYPVSHRNEKAHISNLDVNRSSIYLERRPTISQSLSRTSLQSSDQNYSNNSNNNNNSSTKSVHFVVPNVPSQNSNQLHYYYNALNNMQPTYFTSMNPQSFEYCEMVPLISQQNQQQIQINWQTNSQQFIGYPTMDEGHILTKSPQELFQRSFYSNIKDSYSRMLNSDMLPHIWRSSFGIEADLLHQTSNDFTNIPYPLTTRFSPSQQHSTSCHHSTSLQNPPPPPPPYPKEHKLMKLHTVSCETQKHRDECEDQVDRCMRSSTTLLSKHPTEKEANVNMNTYFTRKTGKRHVGNRRYCGRKHKEHRLTVSNNVNHFSNNEAKKLTMLSIYSDSSVPESSNKYVVKHWKCHHNGNLKIPCSITQVGDSDSPATTDTGITHSSRNSRRRINRHLAHTRRNQQINRVHRHKTCHTHSRNRSTKNINNNISSSDALCVAADKEVENEKHIISGVKIVAFSAKTERCMMSHSGSNPSNLSAITTENMVNSMNRSFSSSDLLYIKHGEYI